ncbi:AAA family ATPase [Thalassoroseus pseudoceratinae]|uniref:AAA family ATPase n=1 Tax=Thalassoroseus pseudoceratinae TaxID=2713176 RepID=UPI00142191A5|nr:AAA family ATPase [Thalassoroseus pseudoceratinae]
MTTELTDENREQIRRFNEDVLQSLKQSFVGKDEVIDLLGLCLIGGENLFILGPPGTAKSALVQALARRIDGRVFDYLLTRFTEPNELFGPFDIRKLRDGELVTNTEGMLPEAAFVFLDELLNANSAILNSLLMVLNERVFRRGRETRKLPTLMVVGASNGLPEDDALGALFDRFLLRVHCDNVSQEQLNDVLSAGWQLDAKAPANTSAAMTVDEILGLQSLIHHVDFSEVRPAYLELVHRLRHAGIAISDRRAVKLQRLQAASALLCGRLTVSPSDLWILRHIWDTEEQQDVISTIVQETLDRTDFDEQTHARAQQSDTPNVESLATDLDRLESRIQGNGLDDTSRVYVQDQLGVLRGRIQWIPDEQPRTFLEQRLEQLWKRLELSE